jgi:hypothetical protein
LRRADRGVLPNRGHVRPCPLAVDERACVDQDGQELPDGPTLERISRSSPAKASSTAGAEKLRAVSVALNRAMD